MPVKSGMADKSTDPFPHRNSIQNRDDKMTSRDFCFWLQGFFEMSGNINLDVDQTTLVKKHLALVFQHEIDPSMGSKTHQDKLNETHAPSNPNLIMRC